MSNAASRVDLDDIQGLLRYGYRKLTQACFLLLQVRDAAAARAWLATCPVNSAVERKPPPSTALHVAFTSQGLRALQLHEAIIEGFSSEFIAGMSGDESRSRRLGDLGSNDPARWQWGGVPDTAPHVLLMLYALPGQLDGWMQQVLSECEAGFVQIACLSTSDMDGVEPFGFADGISEPTVDWDRKRAVRDEELMAYTNLSCLGEFVLGYPNEYGAYTDRPLLEDALDPNGDLARAEEAPDKADFGRNGSYLVLRQLHQDVSGFWRFFDRAASGDAQERVRLAQSMVGRTLNGDPLVDAVAGSVEGESDPRNSFTYRNDLQGLRCPVGAHIRRSNPRNADQPPGEQGLIPRLMRTLGFDAQALDDDHISSTRFHRLLRRGREYGPGLSMQQALSGDVVQDPTGLHFISLGANIARQFEFVQSAWLAGTRFGGLHGESDPIMGNRLPAADGTPTDRFSMPSTTGCSRVVEGLPQFVTVVGGAYFFLPGIRALRFLSKVPP